MTMFEATDIVIASINDLNQGRSAKQRIAPVPDTILFGSGGALDSLGLVELIVTIEERVKKASGVSVSLASDQALSQARSPFKSVRTLGEFLSRLTEDEKSQ
jgi:D-alanine--poly(phosphoribitol) ligase subunit 2